MIYVNAYRVSRHFGGPEEGGWYYDQGEPLASVPLPDDAKDAEVALVKAELQERIGWASPGQGRYSVVGGDDFEMYLEDGFARAFPDERPHYE